MATIRKIQRQSGVVFTAIIKDRLGKAIKSKTFTRKTDARNWANRVEADQEIIESFGTKGAKMTFSELVDEYILQWRGKDSVKQKIRAIYWDGQFGRYRLSEINADKIRMALADLRTTKVKIGNGRGKTAGLSKAIDKTLSNTTINRYRTVLSAIFAYAFRQGYVLSNPVTKTSAMPMPRGRMRYLSDIERRRLLDACRQSEWARLYLLVLMAMSTGYA